MKQTLWQYFKYFSARRASALLRNLLFSIHVSQKFKACSTLFRCFRLPKLKDVQISSKKNKKVEHGKTRSKEAPQINLTIAVSSSARSIRLGTTPSFPTSPVSSFYLHSFHLSREAFSGTGVLRGNDEAKGLVYNAGL